MSTAQLTAATATPQAEKRPASAGIWTDAVWRLRRDPTTLAALGVLAAIAMIAITADLTAQNFFHRSFTQQSLLDNYTAPSFEEPYQWLGTDDLGRSQIVRLMYGARVSLAVGVFGALVSMLVGVSLGISAGYFRGWWDDIVQWVVNTLANIPTLFLFLFIFAYFRPEPFAFTILLGLLGWLGIQLQARGLTFSIREREYTTAARTVGATPARIMFRHILPNILPLMIIVAAVDVAGLILTESALSFIGFGIQPPVASWGNMLTRATQFTTHGPWLIYAPGAMIFVTVLCLYLVGDGLRDALDPRLRGTEKR